MPRYLERRKRRWYAVLDVPKDVQDTLGKRRFVASLGTESLTEAERLVLTVVAQWKAEIDAARRGISLPLELEAKRARDAFERADKDGREIIDVVLSDQLEMLHKQSPSAADTFYYLTKGQSVNLGDWIDEWLATLDNVPKTIDMKRSDVLRFVEAFPYSHLVKKAEVRRWAYETQHRENLKPATVRRIITHCRGYWRYLQRKAYVTGEDDPFADAVERKRSRTKARVEEARGDFSQEDVVKLLAAAKAIPDQQLHDLIAIGMWTGCRIEEICSLKLSEVKDDRLLITDAKSSAGNRVIPIHPQLAPTLQRLRRDSSDGYVLSGLTFNKYGDRSNAVGKRFSRLKTKMGFGGSYVFHSVRKTVATLLENAGVPENIAADILGHEKQTMTYGLYSGGTSFELKRDALMKLSYPL